MVPAFRFVHLSVFAYVWLLFVMIGIASWMTLAKLLANLILMRVCWVETLLHGRVGLSPNLTRSPRGIDTGEYSFFLIAYFKFLLYIIYLVCYATFRILVPPPGIEPRLWQWKRGVLTTGLSGNSQYRCVFLVEPDLTIFLGWEGRGAKRARRNHLFPNGRSLWIKKHSCASLVT